MFIGYTGCFISGVILGVLVTLVSIVGIALAFQTKQNK